MGARARRRGARTSGPVHRGRAVGSRAPLRRFRSLALPERPRAPCAGPVMRTEASGLGPGSAGERIVCRGWLRPRGRGCMHMSFRAGARSPKVEQGRGRGRQKTEGGKRAEKSKTHACTYTLWMGRFADEHDAFRIVYPTLEPWYHNIRLARHWTRIVE